MIFIFAGLGILGVVPPAIVAWLGWMVTGHSPIGTGVGMIIGSVVTWYLGGYLDKTRPARQLAAQMDARSAQLHAMADAGTFYRGPGYLPPASLEEAHRQADDLAVEEYAAIKGKVANKNTLFWIPMQYWAFIGGIVGLIIAVTGING
jgi:hypothetical protein